MAYGLSNGHVTDDLTWPWKVKLVTPIRLERNISKTTWARHFEFGRRLCVFVMPSRRTNNFLESGRGIGHVIATIFGSTIGYPSDSLASCFWLCYCLLMFWFNGSDLISPNANNGLLQPRLQNDDDYYYCIIVQLQTRHRLFQVTVGTRQNVTCSRLGDVECDTNVEQSHVNHSIELSHVCVQHFDTIDMSY